MKEYNTYLFDFDGTLADTTRLIVYCFHEMLARHNIHGKTDEDIIQNIGMPLIPQLELFMGAIPSEEHAVVMKEYQSIQFSIFQDYLTLFPKVEETLKELKKRGKALAIVTSRSQKGLDLFLDFLGIGELFDTFVTPEITTQHKPSPEPALKALERLGATKKGTLFIGDASFDINCGDRAGLDTAFVRWSYNKPEELPVQPTFFLEEISDLLK